MKNLKFWSLAMMVFVACSFQSTKKEIANPKIIYVYDALCGWCFGFSSNMAKLSENYKNQIDFEVVSGGLKLGTSVGSINDVAPFIKTGYKDVEKATGVKFSDKFVQGNLKEGTMILNSLPPAIAMTIMKEKYPEKALKFAALLHQMIYIDAYEPENYEAYGEYASQLGYDKQEFNLKMKDKEYAKKAQKEFEFARELEVNTFPTVILEHNGKRELLFAGYLSFDKAKKIIDGKL